MLMRGSRLGAVVNSTSSLSQLNVSPADHAQPVGSRLRKRGRNESLANNESLLSSPSAGEQSPNIKRAKTQTSAEESPQWSRRIREPPATHAPAEGTSSSQDHTLSAEQVAFATSTPDMVSYDGTLDDQYGYQEYGEMSASEPFSQGLQLRTQSLPVLDNFVSSSWSDDGIIANSLRRLKF